jgi:hypothetical protein
MTPVVCHILLMVPCTWCTHLHLSLFIYMCLNNINRHDVVPQPVMSYVLCSKPKPTLPQVTPSPYLLLTTVL